MEPSLTEPVTLIRRKKRSSDTNPNPTRKGAKRPRNAATTPNTSDTQTTHSTFPRLLDGHEPQFHCTLCQQLYSSDAQLASSVFLNAWDQAHAATVADLAHFVTQAWTSKHARPPHTIPTALVLSGVNVADSFRAFDMLTTTLCSESSSLISARTLTVTLTADSMSTLRLALRTILSAFTGTPSDDIDDLTAWFTSLPAAQQPPSLVLLIPAFESCDFSILSRLLPILATTLASHLPLVLIFGISSLLETVARALDPQAFALLCTTSYRLVAGRDALDHALRSLFLDPSTTLRARLTAPVLDWMLTRFHHATQSGAETARAVKYALMDHYFGGALAGLAVGHVGDRAKVVDDMTDEQCQLLRALPTVRAWMERAAAFDEDDNDDEGAIVTFQHALKLLQSDKALKSQLVIWLADLDVAITRHARAVSLVHAMQARLAKVTRRSLARLYAMSLEENLATSTEDSAGVRVFVALIRKVAWDGHTAPAVVLSDTLNVLSTIRDHLCPAPDEAGDNGDNELVAELDAHVAAHAEFIAEIAASSSSSDQGDSDANGASEGDDDDDGDDQGEPQATEDMGQRLLATMHKALERSKTRPIRTARPARGERRKLAAAAAAAADSSTSTTAASGSVNQLALALLNKESSDRASWSAAKRALSSSSRARPLHQRIAQFVSSVCDWLMGVLEEWLEPPTARPVAEVRFQGRVAALERTFTMLPSTLVKTALARPELFLSTVIEGPPAADADATENDLVLVRATDPDTAILYKLHLESGRLVNLFDWFTAFRAVIARGHGYAHAGDEQDHEKEDQDGQVASKQQRRDFVRFIRGVNELQMLGIVKATSRKTDHVVRLTWGKV
ncbi:origin recognition complex subunit 3 N-terminus-domain-containing protein [Catenaria anguillulae PL171]|uniref:Origin recognition complex subunit 3 N-terminus-domain-containing protein n=1 Tax=Catenaria anguillulae PL171 TaxID=765915 RepID=A0A1Y2I194_9FUNG|nr:origin recognition complex subunit 3 N-terminus-domain-containing protein [Catenaria anguillulae PL171]